MLYLIFLLIVLIIFIPINTTITFNQKTFYIKIYNIIVINLFKKKKTNKVKVKPKRKINLNLFYTYRKEIIKSIKYLFKRLNIKLKYNITVSSSDAFNTAMIFGALNSLLPALFTYLSYNYKFKYKGNIYCDFNSTKSKIEFNVLISFNLITIIIFLIKSLLIFIKIYKGGVLYGRASNRRINENYNG